MAKGKVSAHPARVAGTIYGQRDNDSGVAIVSQNFEASLDAYDSQGADDFKIKNKGTVKEVDVDGLYFNGAGPADSIDVYFYKANGTAPGGIVKHYANRSYTDTTGLGTFKIKVPKTVLKKGNYWVSVVVNMDFATGGEWGWGTNNTQRQKPAVWRNPGDGFASGCTTFSNMQGCIGALGEGPDFSFALIGKGH